MALLHLGYIKSNSFSFTHLRLVIVASFSAASCLRAYEMLVIGAH